MSQGLAELRQRKRELMLESEINREILKVEFAQLRIKAADWRRGLLKARTVYNFVAPLAGAGLALFMVRKKLRGSTSGHARDGKEGSSKATYLKLLAPLGIAALRRAATYLQQRKAERAV